MKHLYAKGDCYALAKHKLKQHTIRYISLLAVLTIMCLYAVKQVSAQEAEPAATAVTDTAASVRDTLALEEVQVNTGYQRIPKERATGSFVFIDSATYHRSVSPNILERLDGVTGGLIINKGLPANGNNSFLSIRGRSTIFGNPEPLIVIDGFPFEGDISQINASDVSSVSVLRDAAAASIWGIRSANGVIVISTKKGEINQPVRIEVGAVASVADRPDIRYQRQLNAEEYLGLEKQLFDLGYYNTAINSGWRPISEGVALYARLKDGRTTQEQADKELDELAARDVRSEMEKLIYRPEILQQYRFQITGGGAANTFFLSGSHNRMSEQLQGHGNERTTLDAKTSLKLLDDRLDVSTNLGYAYTSSRFGGAASNYRPYSPYERLRGENGEALPVVATLQLAYADTAGNGRLLDWHYRPLDELDGDFTQDVGQIRLQFDSRFKVLPFLYLIGAYQYRNVTTESERLSGMERYYTRNLINQFSYWEGNTLIRPIPEGSIAEQRRQNTNYRTYRFQLQFDKAFGTSHQVNAIFGYEGNDSRSNSSSQTHFGYDPATKMHANATINPMQVYNYYYAPNAARISTAGSAAGQANTGQSYYGNATYSFRRKYDASASFRRDESNLFGVKGNQRGVPLWSAGLAWHLDREDFFKIDWLPQFRLRFTYGYNGNVDKSLSAYLTMRHLDNLTALWGGPFGEILNPPNPSLRWEKVRTWNGGIDFSIYGRTLSGSVDFYRKLGADLIGNSPIAPQTGITAFRGNNSSTKTSGVDIALSSLNIDKLFKWRSDLLVSLSHQIITDFSAKPGTNVDIVSNNFSNPLEGYPYYAVFSIPSAGLDSAGNPQGYLDGEVSSNYASILRLIDADQIRFHGSAAPTTYGSLRNTFTYGSLSLSFNIAFKFGYYFRRSNVFNGSQYGFEFSGYAQRWQQPGDEAKTYIPSFSYPANSNRASFFRHSDHLVHRGDHFRIQDIRLSWQPQSRFTSAVGVNNAQMYLLASRFGTIWQASDTGIDPDYPVSRFRDRVQISFGMNVNF